MPVAISALKSGDRLYTVVRQKMGNTTIMKSLAYPVIIEDVDPDHVFVVARIYYDGPKKYYANGNGKLPWHRKNPLLPRELATAASAAVVAGLGRPRAVLTGDPAAPADVNLETATEAAQMPRRKRPA